MRTDDRARFKHVGEAGDTAISSASASIVGMGAIGTAVAEMLVRENIELRMIDKGRVEEEDMHRLALFYEEDITKFKVKQAKARLNAINPQVPVKSFHEELSASNVFLLKGDVIVDTSNNRTINDVIALHAKTPLVIARYSGSVAKILVAQKKVTKKMLDEIDLPPIGTEGVFGPVTTQASSIVVGETLKVLLGQRGSHIITVDSWKNSIRVKKV